MRINPPLKIVPDRWQCVAHIPGLGGRVRFRKLVKSVCWSRSWLLPLSLIYLWLFNCAICAVFSGPQPVSGWSITAYFHGQVSDTKKALTHLQLQFGPSGDSVLAPTTIMTRTHHRMNAPSFGWSSTLRQSYICNPDRLHSILLLHPSKPSCHIVSGDAGQVPLCGPDCLSYRWLLVSKTCLCLKASGEQ